MVNRQGLLVAAVCATLALGACDKPASQEAGDTAAPTAPLAAETPVSWTGTWAPEFGDVLVVPSDTDNTAIVLYPDGAPEALGTRRLNLFATGGDTAVAAITVSGVDSLECGGAPVVRLSGGAFGTWAMGLSVRDGVLRGDSIESMAPRDSARLVASLARLASAIGASEESRFSGLPFAVARARRFTLGRTRVVAAHVVRKVPQEASPLEEHTFLIAERPVDGDSLALRYHQRSEGTEETAEHFEVLSAIAGGPSMLMLVARDNVSGTRYQILERSAAGSWRIRWTRSLRC